MKAVRRENTRFHRVFNDAYERFLERHVQGMEEDLRQRDQPPHIDRRRLTTDPHLRQEVAKKVIGDHLRAFPLSDSSVDNVETAFTTAIL